MDYQFTSRGMGQLLKEDHGNEICYISCAVIRYLKSILVSYLFIIHFTNY